MRFAGTARHTLATMAAVLAVVALAGAALAWRIAGAEAFGAGPVVAQDVDVGPAPSTSSTVAPTTTSTSTSTTSTTSTTVKPKPVPTTAKPPRTTVATTPPAIAPPAPPATQPQQVALPGNSTPAERCANAMQWVNQRGLALPAGWGFRCPGPALENGTPRWGIACWNCEGNGASWIAVDVGRIGASDASLRYVVAHEICHAVEYMGLGISTELSADLCAALHGAPRP